MLVLSLSSYALLAGAYVAIVAGQTKDFLAAFGILLGLRLTFGFVDYIGAEIMFRLYGKRFATKHFFDMLQSGGFPKDPALRCDFIEYLSAVSIEEDDPKFKRVHREVHMYLSGIGAAGGYFALRRIVSAMNAALDAYIPGKDERKSDT